MGSRDAALGSAQDFKAFAQAGLTNLVMAMERGDDHLVYCDIQMPLARGRELLHLATELRESKAHPGLDEVFENMKHELSTSIDIVEDLPTWPPLRQ
jgi:hypothetical protein